jgi:cell division control protein 11
MDSFQEIVGYLERQYDDILAEESRIKRNPRFRDNRVHALLYFISPTGHACVLYFVVINESSDMGSG